MRFSYEYARLGDGCIVRRAPRYGWETKFGPDDWRRTALSEQDWREMRAISEADAERADPYYVPPSPPEPLPEPAPEPESEEPREPITVPLGYPCGTPFLTR